MALLCPCEVLLSHNGLWTSVFISMYGMSSLEHVCGPPTDQTISNKQSLLGHLTRTH